MRRFRFQIVLDTISILRQTYLASQLIDIDNTHRGIRVNAFGEIKIH